MNLKKLSIKQKITGVAFCIAFLLVLVGLTIQYAKLHETQNNIMFLENKIKYLQLSIDETDKKIEEIKSENYILKWAKEFRGWVRKGEIIFKVIT